MGPNMYVIVFEGQDWRGSGKNIVFGINLYFPRCKKFDDLALIQIDIIQLLLCLQIKMLLQ